MTTPIGHAFPMTHAPPDNDVTVVYTDGSCLGNPGPGGWAWAVDGGDSDSGGEPRTTNQRMEMTAGDESVAGERRPAVMW